MAKNISEIRKICREFKKALSHRNIRVAKMILYGSYANGKPKPYSDIDLIVVSPDLEIFSPLQRQELLALLAVNIDAPLEVIGYTPEELKKSNNTIFGQIINQTGKVIN